MALLLTFQTDDLQFCAGANAQLRMCALTVIPEPSCIPATHFEKDDSSQLSSLRGLIFTPILEGHILTRKKSASCGVGPQTTQEARR
jgi:hypothetical protein